MLSKEASSTIFLKYESPRPLANTLTIIPMSGLLKQQSPLFSQVFLIINRFGLLVRIRWSVCISKSQRNFTCFIAKDEFCIAYIPCSNFNFLHSSLWITFLTQLYLMLYSFCANLLHLLIVWLIVSSLSPHNQYLLFFFCVLSRFTLTQLVLMALFCVGIKRYSVSFSYLPTPPLGQDMTQGQFLSGV